MHFITDIGLFFLACVIITIAACHFNTQLSTYRVFERIGYIKGSIDLNHPRYSKNKDFHLHHFTILKSECLRDIIAAIFIMVGILYKSTSVFSMGVILALYDVGLMMYGFRNRYVFQLRENFTEVKYGFVDALRQYRFYELLYWILIAVFLFGYGHLIPL